MNYRIQILNNGYLLTVSDPISGKGDVVQQRLAFSTKAELMEFLKKDLPQPSPFTKGGEA